MTQRNKNLRATNGFSEDNGNDSLQKLTFFTGSPRLKSVSIKLSQKVSTGNTFLRQDISSKTAEHEAGFRLRTSPAGEMKTFLFGESFSPNDSMTLITLMMQK